MTRLAATRFSVLLVCRANHCRSPLAEHLLQLQSERRGLAWEITSAGTDAHAGTPMHPAAAAILASRGLETEGWRSHVVTEHLVRSSDLILTVSEAEQSVVRLSPAVMNRTFTLRQFAHLASAIPADPTVEPSAYGAWLLRQICLHRASIQPLGRGQRDIPDPMGRSRRQFRRCATAIDEALDQMFRSGPPIQWSWSAEVVS